MAIEYTGKITLLMFMVRIEYAATHKRHFRALLLIITVTPLVYQVARFSTLKRLLGLRIIGCLLDMQ